MSRSYKKYPQLPYINSMEKIKTLRLPLPEGISVDFVWRRETKRFYKKRANRSRRRTFNQQLTFVIRTHNI